MTDTAHAETVVPERSESGRSVIGTAVQRMWWLGLGLLATVGEQTARAAEALVDKGREVEPAVLKPVRRAGSSVFDATEGAGARLRRGLGNIPVPAPLRRGTRPTREEFDRLAEEVRTLRDRLADKMDEPT